MEIRECQKCKKQFNFRGCPTDISSGRGIFCSRVCATDSKRKFPKEFICEKCGKIFPNKFGKIKKFCSHKCYSLTLLGKSPSNKGIRGKYKHPNVSKANKLRRGNKHYNWQGGISTLRDKIKRLNEYYEWRKAVFKRDKYTCIFCLITKVNLEADHIKPFAVIRKENNIKSIEDAIACKELWDINNGRTLCVVCHRGTDTWGNKKKL